VTIEGFKGTFHNVGSSSITLNDEKSVTIGKLSYDGKGADAFFYGVPAAHTGNRTWIKFLDETNQ
jgi:hypothetical protein